MSCLIYCEKNAACVTSALSEEPNISYGQERRFIVTTWEGFTSANVEVKSLISFFWQQGLFFTDGSWITLTRVSKQWLPFLYLQDSRASSTQWKIESFSKVSTRWEIAHLWSSESSSQHFASTRRIKSWSYSEIIRHKDYFLKCNKCCLLRLTHLIEICIKM